MLVQAARPFKHTRNELEVLAPNHVAAVDVDDAIAVQERGTSGAAPIGFIAGAATASEHNFPCRARRS